jgi:hypothetical protein
MTATRHPQQRRDLFGQARQAQAIAGNLAAILKPQSQARTPTAQAAPSGDDNP